MGFCFAVDKLCEKGYNVSKVFYVGDNYANIGYSNPCSSGSKRAFQGEFLWGKSNACCGDKNANSRTY